MKNKNFDHLEKKIDEWLKVQQIEAAPDFIEKTLGRLQEEKHNDLIDEKLDQWLTDQPVSPSEAFTSGTLKNIQNEKSQSERVKRITYNLRWWGAVAAVIVISFIALYPKYIRMTKSGSDTHRENAAIVLPTETRTANGHEFDMNELFVLAETLSDASFFLDNNNAETLEVFIQ